MHPVAFAREFVLALACCVQCEHCLRRFGRRVHLAQRATAIKSAATRHRWRCVRRCVRSCIVSSLTQRWPLIAVCDKVRSWTPSAFRALAFVRPSPSFARALQRGRCCSRCRCRRRRHRCILCGVCFLRVHSSSHPSYPSTHFRVNYYAFSYRLTLCALRIHSVQG